jgi:pyridoxal biosynthesis lyase PdxS
MIRANPKTVAESQQGPSEPQRSSRRLSAVLGLAVLEHRPARRLEAAMLVQIYEVATPDEARAVGALGVDHVGVLVGDGRFPRELPVAKAREVISAIVAPAKPSVLMLVDRI